MSKHTPGPWVANEDLIYNGVGDLVTIVSGVGSLDEDMERAARIVACVNACEGINPETVPDLLKAAKLSFVLIEALMPGIEHIAVQDYRAVSETPLALRAAIDKAEGK